jgi:hypothetical protein
MVVPSGMPRFEGLFTRVVSHAGSPQLAFGNPGDVRDGPRHIRALDKAGLLVTVDQPISKAAGIKAMKQ